MDYGKDWGKLTPTEKQFVELFLDYKNLSLVREEMELSTREVSVLKSSANVRKVIEFVARYQAENNPPKTLKEQQRDLEDIYDQARYGVYSSEEGGKLENPD